MSHAKREDLIGERHAETLERVQLLLQEHRADLTSWAESFLCGLEEKLETYGERAFVNAAQLNRLSDIEQRVASRRPGR